MTFPATPQSELPFTPELMHTLLLATCEAPGADFRVLSYYATAVPLGETVRKTAKEIAQAIQLSPPNTGKSIRRLVEGGWLQVSYRMGRVTFYRVGPRVTALAAESAESDSCAVASVSYLPSAFGAEEQ
ncbi:MULTISPECIES: winged helix-turn-helix domain-containing protein [unclassified Streptomyces]|uniref:winged helix-turn-helix domain-containing protein n=1 Tax=unclassified Streptomyces TaxID=2593676 RepID=UPI0023EAA1A4|nr:winged helix-turn-helix domain-containing protein [Streptomyces sp. WMMB303]MDF4254569.1 winged helix-turn-helix domain-containing protein [Streptomyces sp. WMMB303]